MKTIIALTTLLLVGCNSFTISGQYTDWKIDKERNITVSPKVFYAK